MLRFRRPDKPEDFDKRTLTARERVERAVESGVKPEFEPPIWRQFKGHYAEAQHRKCAYCERKVTSVGAIDHFRPKSAVSELEDDPTTWGREKPHLANFENRHFKPLSDRGYWWLAYEWANLLLACDRCNSWKGSLFPVADPAHRELPPRPDVDEAPWVLDPCGDDDPAAHLRFDTLGTVQPKDDSTMGFETIRTLGLDRESLRDARREKALRMSALLEEIRQARDRAIDKILKDILELGRADYPHAGMVRILLEQELGIGWQEIEDAQI